MKLAIIGGGPAGLRAAERAIELGLTVHLFDAKPSVGRKFLVAGRGGLNLSKDEPWERMAARYHGTHQPSTIWGSLLKDFDSIAMRAWAQGLDVQTFVGTSNRIYPQEMKSAPLLRRWVHRLKENGVHFAMNHRWVGLQKGKDWVLEFQVQGQMVQETFPAVILALGGGSWPETGSTGHWVSILEQTGVKVWPLVAANCGWEVDWSEAVSLYAEGEPVKNLIVQAGNITVAGELLITKYGLEGGSIYYAGQALRQMDQPTITIDFKPTFTVPQLVGKMGSTRNCVASVRQKLKLSKGAYGLLGHVYGAETWYPNEVLAEKIKKCVIPLKGPRAIAEAISSAGGVCWKELNSCLMIEKLPGIFICGEMIDWEAPTGGYLLQGCFATANRAAQGAKNWLCATSAMPSGS